MFLEFKINNHGEIYFVFSRKTKWRKMLIDMRGVVGKDYNIVF